MEWTRLRPTAYVLARLHAVGQFRTSKGGSESRRSVAGCTTVINSSHPIVASLLLGRAMQNPQ